MPPSRAYRRNVGVGYPRREVLDHSRAGVHGTLDNQLHDRPTKNEYVHANGEYVACLIIYNNPLYKTVQKSFQRPSGLDRSNHGRCCG